MPEKNEKFFKVLEDLAEMREIRDYPSAESSDYKWYERYKKNPTEHLRQRIIDELSEFPNQLLKKWSVLDNSGMLMADPEADIRKKIEAALNFWTFHSKKFGGDWSIPVEVEEGIDKAFSAPEGININYREDIDDPYSR